MIVTKRAIDRRSVLRGLGVTVALPLLDAMVPALAILKAGSVIPNSLKINVPAIAKEHKTTKQVQAARRAIRFLCSVPVFAVMIKNAGTAAIGSTRTKTEVKATNENCRRSARGPDIQVSALSTCVYSIEFPLPKEIKELAAQTFVPAVACCVAAVLIADAVWFQLGKRRGRRILLFSKFIPGLNAVAAPLAGSSGAAGWRFLACDAAGAVIWSTT